MKPSKITPITKDIIIRFEGKKVALPIELQAKIDEHWQTLINANPRLFNGESFTIVDLQETDAGMQLELAQTDYAHSLYSDAHDDLGDYAVRVIHTAGLIITSDNKLIFGAMNQYTSRPGAIVCSGGGLDLGDVRDGVIDIEHSTAHELREELGLDIYDSTRVKTFHPAYLKSDGPSGKMSLVYEVRLTQNSSDFMQAYSAFTKELLAKAEEPEFEQLFAIDNTPLAVEEFLAEYRSMCDEYMPILLKTVAQNAMPVN